MNNELDNSLFIAMKNGDHDAYGSIFKKYYPALCAYAHRYVGMDDVEDVVEDCLVWLWEKRKNITLQTTLSRYLFSAVRNKSLNLLARRGIAERAASWYFDALKEQSIMNIDYYQTEELKRIIVDSIQSLPETYREAFVMHRFQGLSYSEIAKEKSVSTKTIDYRIQQALKIMRKHLSDYLPLKMVALIMAYMANLYK